MNMMAPNHPLMKRCPHLVYCTIATVMLLVACKRNHPPSTPDVTGLLLSRPRDTAEFSATSTDRDDDLISYLFAWGDTSSAPWSVDYPSGVLVSRGHVYADSGAYAVRARARDDKGAESDWSPTETLRVGFFAPGMPTRPVGPTSGLPGIAYEYSTHTTSPYGESLFIQFDWDGSLGVWGGPVASDSPYVTTHTFDSSGLYVVRARARDKVDSTSAWSDSLMVAVVAQDPYIPARPTGPSAVRASTTKAYSTWSEDPNGDSILYIFDWDDGKMDTTDLHRSGDTVSHSHAWSDTGTYYLRATARDSKGNFSVGWSEALVVNVASNHPPDAPVRPTHAGGGSVGRPMAFTTSATDPDNDSVQIKFYFDDGGTPGFGPKVASGAICTDTVTYAEEGWKAVRAVAMDDNGDTSAWSAPESVDIKPGGVPYDLMLAAATDSTVRITWSAPADTAPNRYVVSFRETGTALFDSVGGTQSLSLVHDPAGKTGQYQVTAVYDSARYTSTATPATTPIEASVLLVPELNGNGKAGYGWNRISGEVAMYDMTLADSADKVDLYVTDFAQGFAGPDYSVANPFLAPQDPGGGVPAGAWHIVEFTHLDTLMTENDPLPRYAQSRYRDSMVLAPLPTLTACHTEDGYYALMKTTDVDTVNGTADIQTWFQLVQDLRLIEH